MTEFFDRHEIITPKQFGFRKAHSTTHPLLNVKNFIERKLQQKQHVILISLDLSKAFVCIDTNKILQSKIKYYTGSDKITNWINSFYKNRTQYTTWEDSQSELIKNHNISVVQGSSMGPKLFNVYLNDLPSVSELFDISLFADDSNFLVANSDLNLLEKQANTELQKIKDYFDSNGLSINISKTTYLYFNPKQKNRGTLKIKLGNEKLKESNQLTFLGINIDNKLAFKDHFEKVHEKAKKGLNGLILTKNKLNFRAKMNIYHSLIHSHFNYGALIWISNLTNKQIKALQTIQKKALRIIYNKRYNSHTADLFRRSKITKIENIFEKESLLLIYKFLNKSLPLETQQLIQDNLQNTTDSRYFTPSIETRSRTNLNLKPKRALRKGNMIFDIISNWNKFETINKGNPKIKEFKNKIDEIQNSVIECKKDNCYACNNME